MSGDSIELVPDSFVHLINVTDMLDRSENAKYRTIKITRQQSDDLGFCVRKGDGWSRRDGIFISRLVLGNIFDLYGILSIGEEIVKVNETDVTTMDVGEAVRCMYDCTDLSLTIRVPRTVRSRFRKKCKKVKQPVNHSIDYKILNMKINVPQKERHVFEEPCEDVPEVEEPVCDESPVGEDNNPDNNNAS